MPTELSGWPACACSTSWWTTPRSGARPHAWLWTRWPTSSTAVPRSSIVLAPWLPLMQGQGHGFH
ncbi:MAG: hypothetical protein HS111_13205 [Kofleriaceae bacterium]|nr:hypothetical protein [Kofleriaceae bacterium]